MELDQFSFSIAPEVQSTFPELKVGVLLAEGIHNTAPMAALDGLFVEVEQTVAKQLSDGGVPINELPEVRQWKQAYKLFPSAKKARVSLEYLLKRISSGKPLPRINGLVDAYNLISAKHRLPCGGEDLSKLKGHGMSLKLAIGNEPFLPLGAKLDQIEFPNPGEVIYADAEGTVCRSINYLEADRTKLTSETTAAVFVVEDLTGDTAKLETALEELEVLLSSFFATPETRIKIWIEG